MGRDLEAPAADAEGKPNWGSLYRARGSEVSASRPIFTGDVFEGARLSDGTISSVIILQHPCALRTNGVDLNPKLLVATVNQAVLIPLPGWTGNYKKMPLPELDGTTPYAANFTEPGVAKSAELDLSHRLATMSQFGVNLLLQRWVHHNSRAIVPSQEFQLVTSAEYEEADLTEDWCDERLSDGFDVGTATSEAHDWFRSKALPEPETWQEQLEDPQKRSSVRKAMRAELKTRRANDPDAPDSPS